MHITKDVGIAEQQKVEIKTSLHLECFCNTCLRPFFVRMTLETEVKLFAQWVNRNQTRFTTSPSEEKKR